MRRPVQIVPQFIDFAAFHPDRQVIAGRIIIEQCSMLC